MIDTQPIDALETKIAQVLERLVTLQSERNELQKQISAWESRCEETARQLELVTRERDALKRNQRDPNCTGEGRCHGCLCWCDNCGEVSEVCDDRLCDTHRPEDCCGKSPRGCECLAGMEDSR